MQSCGNCAVIDADQIVVELHCMKQSTSVLRERIKTYCSEREPQAVVRTASAIFCDVVGDGAKNAPKKIQLECLEQRGCDDRRCCASGECEEGGTESAESTALRSVTAGILLTA